MKPEDILQSNLLDILFENRNKAYGAYELRKAYNRRLVKALTITMSLVVALLLVRYISEKYFGDKLSIVTGVPVIDIHLVDVSQPPDPKLVEPEKPKPQPKQQLAQIANPTIKIVPDDLADKDVPENKDLENKIISLATTPGDAVDEGMVILPAGDGKENKIIEQPVPKAAEEIKEPLHSAEIMPEFPGGMEAFRKFLFRNLRQQTLEEGEKVVVKVRFVVGEDGIIKDLAVIESGGELDGEVIRVVKKMPRWKPGVQNGRPVPVYFLLPVTFKGGEE